MGFKKLVEHFDRQDALPIEIPAVRKAVMNLADINGIEFRAEPVEPTLLRGIYYEYEYDVGPYAGKGRIVRIPYSNKLDLPWQRVVCCKELIHCLDKVGERTTAPADVEDLLNSVLSKAPYGFGDVRAAKDRLALYQAIVVLCPRKARDYAVQAFDNGILEEEEIARRLCLPDILVRLVLTKEWPEIKKVLLDC